MKRSLWFQVRVYYATWASIIIGLAHGKTLEQILDEAVEERSRLMHEGRQLRAELIELQQKKAKREVQLR